MHIFDLNLNFLIEQFLNLYFFFLFYIFKLIPKSNTIFYINIIIIVLIKNPNILHNLNGKKKRNRERKKKCFEKL